eukprot:scaffold130444_cov30-Phaeocystis_antarctica.AAC.1
MQGPLVFPSYPPGPLLCRGLPCVAALFPSYHPSRGAAVREQARRLLGVLAVGRLLVVAARLLLVVIALGLGLGLGL